MESNARFLFLNLPSEDKITRRYMCSYQSPTSLFPPLELLSLAAAYRAVTGKAPMVLDAIASGLGISGVSEYMAERGVTHVVSLIGFECFEEDMEAIRQLKHQHPKAMFTVFGHYPTLFGEELLERSAADFVLMGEPEELFIAALNDGRLDADVGKLVIKGTQTGVGTNRVLDYASLPMPAYDLLSDWTYHEPMMARPFGMIQTARGCPYSCNYCVKSFGSKLTMRPAEAIVEEIQLLQRLKGIRSLRFIDDTFTIRKQRVLELCALMQSSGIRLEWSCLSRTDNVDAEMLRSMRAVGCKRIYFGIESGSQRILDLYDKGLNAEQALEAVRLTNEHGIESAGFFMLGLPEETEEDFHLTRQFILNARFDYVGIGGLVLYPGTALFNRYRDQLEFSLLPYVNRFKDEELQRRYLRWNKELYNAFLTSPAFLGGMATKALSSPVQTMQTMASALGYQMSTGQGVFHHIQRHRQGLSYNVS
jgi:anaerobic magnesium-protoporphyrin IX monomethyl ester cyclase